MNALKVSWSRTHNARVPYRGLSRKSWTLVWPERELAELSVGHDPFDAESEDSRCHKAMEPREESRLDSRRARNIGLTLIAIGVVLMSFGYVWSGGMCVEVACPEFVLPGYLMIGIGLAILVAGLAVAYRFRYPERPPPATPEQL